MPVLPMVTVSEALNFCAKGNANTLLAKALDPSQAAPAPQALRRINSRLFMLTTFWFRSHPRAYTSVDELLSARLSTLSTLNPQWLGSCAGPEVRGELQGEALFDRFHAPGARSR